MNNISYIGGTAEQVHAKIAELIRNGNTPTLIRQYQPDTKPVNVNNNHSEHVKYAQQVINLGRKS